MAEFYSGLSETKSPIHWWIIAPAFSRVKTFFYITLPLLMPALLMVTLFRFIDSLKHFPMIFVMTKGGPGRSTQATNFYAYVQTFQNSNVAYGAAIAVMLFLMAALVSFYVARLNQRISK